LFLSNKKMVIKKNFNLCICSSSAGVQIFQMGKNVLFLFAMFNAKSDKMRKCKSSEEKTHKNAKNLFQREGQKFKCEKMQ